MKRYILDDDSCYNICSGCQDDFVKYNREDIDLVVKADRNVCDWCGKAEE